MTGAVKLHIKTIQFILYMVIPAVLSLPQAHLDFSGMIVDFHKISLVMMSGTARSVILFWVLFILENRKKSLDIVTCRGTHDENNWF
jgi:hypothetical protein